MRQRLIAGFLLLIPFFYGPKPVLAQYTPNGLWHLSDMITTFKEGVRAEHSVSFTLPTNSLPVITTDYIHIYLEPFTNVTLPTTITGTYAGFPVYSLNGRMVTITGITIQPGEYIQIDGISANNPPVLGDYQVQVIITADQAGTMPKNSATTFATLFRGNVSVTATIPEPLAQLRISGYAAPGTFVIFTEAGAIIGTEVTNSNGVFTHLFSGLQPTTHHINFYGVDLADRSTAPINIEIYTPPYQCLTVSDQMLSPTMELNGTQFTLADTVIASGSALPGGSLTLFTDSPLRTYYASAAADGTWTFPIPNLADYIYGDYRIYALAQNGFGLQSLVSHTLAYSIKSTLGGGVSCGDITRGDLNCDGNVDLTDFSILMYYWATPDATADINADGVVNLTDFSILMYYWGT